MLRLGGRCGGRWSFAVIILFAVVAFSGSAQSDGHSAEASIDRRWDGALLSYLHDSLWIARDAYDAGHVLMVPLHAAFALDRESWQIGFSEHAQRFLDHVDTEFTDNLLHRLQYLYVWSRFAVLAADATRPDLIPDRLPDVLRREVIAVWRDRPAWQWDRAPFPGGMRDRLAWKLGQPRDITPSYYRALIDEELFVFAIAADLAAFDRLRGHSADPNLSEILQTAVDSFRSEVSWDGGGGWLLQPGVWADHPDYAYAGRVDKRAGLDPAPVPGIAMDTSHAHRMGLWLTSLRDAYPRDSPEHRYFDRLRDGLSHRFFSHVLVPPSETFQGYRTNNFLDGRNGIFRWGYVTQGAGDGYGPYELSGTLLHGWWAFLGDARVCRMYEEMSALFPLSEDAIALYVGPNTTRDRHPLVSDPASYRNGVREALVSLAAEVCWRAD